MSAAQNPLPEALGCDVSPLVSLGDVNDDGVPDLSLGADGLLWNGGVFTISGKTGELLYSVPVPKGACYFGASSARVADANGDGVSDLLVGSNALRAHVRKAKVYLVSGRDGRVLSGFGRDELTHDSRAPK